MRPKPANQKWKSDCHRQATENGRKYKANVLVKRGDRKARQVPENKKITAVWAWKSSSSLNLECPPECYPTLEFSEVSRGLLSPHPPTPTKARLYCLCFYNIEKCIIDFRKSSILIELQKLYLNHKPSAFGILHLREGAIWFEFK